MTGGPITHDHLCSIVQHLPSDYWPYGKAEREGADCSCGCRWYAALLDHPDDWGVCTNPEAPRCGLLTFEHQNGATCYAPPTPNTS